MRFIILLLFLPFTIFSQVQNDDIAYAKKLELFGSISSSTEKCTIQSACVNYALTKSCIKYHNDQWFYFNTGAHADLYINVSNQDCRDLFGVQVVVLEGQACEPETYDLITCISLGTNDDVYVPLNNLKRNTTYLVLIDGYLHDFCSFKLNLDTVPKGLPNEINMTIESTMVQNESLVNFQWRMSEDSVQLFSHFEVWKRKDQDFKYQLHKKVHISRNTYGIPQAFFSFSDTLTTSDLYHFNLVAIDPSGKKYLFEQYQVKGVANRVIDRISLKLNYPPNTPLTIEIYEKATGRTFRKVSFSFNPEKHGLLEYPISYFLDEGVEILVAEIMNDRSGAVVRKEFVLQKYP